MKIDYVHLFDFGGCKLSKTNGRQLNFLDYSQHFATKHSDTITNYLLYDRKNFVEIFSSFFLDPSINKLRQIDRTAYKYITEEYFNDHGDILLCDFVTLIFLIHFNIPIESYKNILVFDCLELTVFLRDLEYPSGIVKTFSILNSDILLKFINNNKVTFLITDYNVPDIQKYDFDYLVYYKKINFDIFNKDFLNSLETYDDLCYYYAYQNKECEEFNEFISTISNKYPKIFLTEKFMDIWEHKQILYTQKPYVGNIEQFGRMIFELKHFGYEVIIDNFLCKEEKTGLEYYFDYYDGMIPSLNDENFLEVINERL